MTTFRLNPTNSYDGEGRPWYDTKEGIEKSIKTLNDFLNLRHVRHIAGYKRSENLNQIYVLGDYSFDTCGNCSIASPSIKKKYPGIPDVMTHEEYWTYLRVNSTDKEMHGVSFATNEAIPSEQIICPKCNKGWTIENMTDVISRDSYMDYCLEYFVGQKLKDVKEHYAAKTDALYRIGTEPFLHNRKFIDLSPWTENPKSELEKKMVKNDSGWVGTKDGINDDYVICESDKITLSLTHFFHSNCNREDLEDNQKKSFEEHFLKAGYAKYEMTSIKNEYCGCPHCAPWYLVETEIGKIKIGWRNHVINIDWSAISNDDPGIPSLFESEDVTKGMSSIHAWSYDKAIEYLTKIKSHFNK